MSTDTLAAKVRAFVTHYNKTFRPLETAGAKHDNGQIIHLPDVAESVLGVYHLRNTIVPWIANVLATETTDATSLATVDDAQTMVICLISHWFGIGAMNASKLAWLASYIRQPKATAKPLIVEPNGEKEVSDDSAFDIPPADVRAVLTAWHDPKEEVKAATMKVASKWNSDPDSYFCGTWNASYQMLLGYNLRRSGLACVASCLYFFPHTHSLYEEETDAKGRASVWQYPLWVLHNGLRYAADNQGYGSYEVNALIEGMVNVCGSARVLAFLQAYATGLGRRPSDLFYNMVVKVALLGLLPPIAVHQDFKMHNPHVLATMSWL